MSFKAVILFLRRKLANCSAKRNEPSAESAHYSPAIRYRLAKPCPASAVRQIRRSPICWPWPAHRSTIHLTRFTSIETQCTSES
jgi:hypothetical protein